MEQTEGELEADNDIDRMVEISSTFMGKGIS